MLCFTLILTLLAVSGMKEGYITLKAATLVGDMRITVYVSGERVRIDVLSLPAQAGKVQGKGEYVLQQSALMTELMAGSKGRSFVLIDHKTKTYEPLRENKLPVASGVAVEAKGLEKIKSYLCKRFVLKDRDKQLAEVWVSSDILSEDVVSVIAEAGLIPGFDREIVSVLRQKNLLGFPLKIIVGDGFSLGLEKVQKAKLSARVFSIPDGFKSMQDD